MTQYTAETLDLSRVGAPTLADTAAEPLLKARLAKFVELWNAARALDPTLPEYDLIAPDGTARIETDPAVILSQEAVHGEVHLLQALNDHANALRLATAVGADLDHIAQTYKNTPRLITASGNPIGDAEYREMAQLSDEALPLFGITPGGYVWRVKRTFGDRVRGVRALRRENGRIDLIILARTYDGTPEEELIGDIQGAFDGEDGFQSTDIVTVLPAQIMPTAIRVKVFVPRGPDRAVVRSASEAALATLSVERHAIGETLHKQAVGAAARVGAARYVDVIEPAADIVGGEAGAPFVSSITVEMEIDE